MRRYNLWAVALSMMANLWAIPFPAFGQAKFPERHQHGTILHAFCWSFNTIRENLPAISKAGYTMVQTSPANKCYVGEEGGMEIFGKGKWYYHYQPVEWSIGNYQLGSEDDFRAMTSEAHKYGITILVDVLPNHTAFDTSAVTEEFLSAVGGYEKLYHANGMNPIKNYDDRFECTTGGVGGLPDVNTENPLFQYYFLTYVNRLIADGAGGFRYDTAKHIGLPSDPLDEKSSRNNFWPVALGLEPIQGQTLSNRDELFIYGEVLQGKNVKEREYSHYMGLTASEYGAQLRRALTNHSFKGLDLVSWHHKADPKHLVTWVESHDTYCNEGESSCLTDAQIRCGWTLLAARASGVPLFLSRPEGSSPENRWGNNHIGKRGNSNFLHPTVIAANRFRQAMAGEPEKLYFSKDSTVVEVARGSRGVALINLGEEQSISLPTALPDGKYRDAVHGEVFQVVAGRLIGTVGKEDCYLISI